MKIAAFISHPIQYFTPLWQELTSREGVELTVFYFAQRLESAYDPGFGLSFAWNIDLLAGYEHRFLPRQWPTRDPLDYTPRGLNRGIVAALRQGWDCAFVNGYAHANNWLITAVCAHMGVPVLCFGDTILHGDKRNSYAKLVAKRAALSLIMPRISAFLAAGGQSRTYFEHYGAPPGSVFICPYAVDVERFKSTVSACSSERWKELRAKWRIPENKRIVMFCGKLAPWKRPLDVARAVRNLERTDTVAVFVGEGELRGALEKEDSQRVVTTGFVNQGEIPLVLALADVLVLSSEFEPYGMVVAEAQCLGKPAIVTDACGCQGPDSVVDVGRSGLVYRAGDVAALTDKLRSLLDDSLLFSRMQAAAKLQGETQSKQHSANGFLAAAAYAIRAKRRVPSGAHL